MKRKSAFLTFAACALMAAHAPAKAAAEKSAPTLPASLKLPGVADFSTVQTVAVGEGVGFFDTRTGTMYVYDPSLTQCIAIKKLKSLGAPAEIVDIP